jgi:nucleoside-diphosphate-sugar epimerase
MAAETVVGNLLSEKDCLSAVSGASIVYHLAAGIEKSFAGCFMNSVLTTRNLLEAARRTGGLKRFVNVSSFAVYSNLNARRGSVLDERSPVETDPGLRHDAYGFGKMKQEEIVRKYRAEFGIPYVILRPGVVYGPGNPALSGRIGIDTFGIFLHIGGSNRIPITYVDNCAEAIARAGVVEGIEGEIFNIVDDEPPTSRQFLRMYKRGVRRFRSIPVPYRVAQLMCALWEDYSHRSQGQLPPSFNRRRCAAEWKGNLYSNQKIKDGLGWEPRIRFEQASRLYVDSFKGRS